MLFRIFIGVILIICAYLAYETVRLKIMQHSLLQAPVEYSLGNADGDLVFVSFFDYNCAQCRASLPLIKAAVEQDEQVKFIPRPIQTIENDGVDPALVLYAAGKHGKFKEMHESLFNHYREINGQVLMDLAEEVGIDAEALKADVKSEEVAKLANRNVKLFQHFQLNGTPAYAVGKDILFVSDRDFNTDEFIDLFKEARGH